MVATHSTQTNEHHSRDDALRVMSLVILKCNRTRLKQKMKLQSVTNRQNTFARSTRGYETQVIYWRSDRTALGRARHDQGTASYLARPTTPRRCRAPYHIR